jgi:hypothetical protein
MTTGTLAQRRVYTNDDVASPPPPPPPAAAEATPNDTAPGPASQPSATANEGQPRTPLQQAQDLQQVLQRTLAEFQAKMESETNASRKERLTRMAEWLELLVESNQQIINEQSPQPAPPQPGTPRES